MAAKSMSDPVPALRRFALGYAEVQEGVACKGTALEKSSFAVGKKTFLFLGRDDLMLKLTDSLPQAATLAATAPECCRAGATGWVTIRFRHEHTPPFALLRKWIDESYQMMATKNAKPARKKGKTTGRAG